MEVKCPYCRSEDTQDVVIRLSNQQEQRVMLCNGCKKIFKKEKKDES